MALEKQCSRYLMKGLGITAYDSESDVGVVYEDIITSERYGDTENNTFAFGKLGTVFSIRAYGYRAFVESTAADPFAEARAIKFEGASRICIYPKDTHYPLQIVAYTGRSSSGSAIKPNFFPGYYLTEDSVSPNVSGMMSTAPMLPDRWYITATYENLYAEDQLTFWVSTTPDFSDVTGNYWPIAITSVTRKQYLDGSNPDADWVLQYIAPKEYDGADIKPSAILSGFQIGTVVRLMREKIEKKDPVGYLYGTPSENGNIGLRVGDTVTYYNGVVPQNVDEVYTDEMKAQYPNVVIYSPSTNVYYLKMFPTNSYYSKTASDKRTYRTDDPSMIWYWRKSENIWYGGEVPESGQFAILENVIWTNFNLLNSDNTIYLSATDPIPVYGIVDYNGDIPIYEY